MGIPSLNVLIGCGEAAATESMRLVLSDSLTVANRNSFVELAQEATAGDFDVVIVYGNCLLPPLICSGGLLENTLAAIKTVRASRSVPILAATSADDWSELLLAAGANDCLRTPLDAAAFRKAVLSCLGDRAGLR